MGLIGKLEDLPLPEIFSLLSLSQKTGKLSLRRGEEKAVVIFDQGRVIQAATGNRGRSLGRLLLLQKSLKENELRAAMEIQKCLPRQKPLGAVLVEKGFISPETLENTVKKQIEASIFEVLGWKEGLFNFEPGETDLNDALLGVEAHEFLLAEGIKPEYLIMEGTRLADEEGREVLQAAEAAPVAPPPEEAFTDSAMDISLAEAGKNMVTPGELDALRSMFMELRLRSLNGEITLLIMRYASETVDRGIFLMVKNNHICGLGQFGLESNGASAEQQVRSLRIPLEEPSIFSWPVERGQAYKGHIPKNPGNDYLVDLTGGHYPREVLVIPMVMENKVVALVYGDNLPSERPIKNEESLEIFINQAGLAMEKALLEHRLQELQKDNPLF